MTRAVLLGAVALGISGCAQMWSADRVVHEGEFTLGEGEAKGYNLGPGSYRIEMSAEPEGASVEWIGGECPTIPPARATTATCRIRKLGQVLLRNPPDEGTGSPIVVRVEVVRLGSELED